MLKNIKLIKIVPVAIAVVMLISILTYEGYSFLFKNLESRNVLKSQINAFQNNSSTIDQDAIAGASENPDNTNEGQLKGPDTNSGASQNLNKAASGRRH